MESIPENEEMARNYLTNLLFEGKLEQAALEAKTYLEMGMIRLDDYDLICRYCDHSSSSEKQTVRLSNDDPFQEKFSSPR